VKSHRYRIAQAGLKLLLEPIFKPDFSPNSYGFRPGRSPKQAVEVEAAKTIVNNGKRYIVDVDLANFFDRINHDRLIARMGQKLKDKRILRPIYPF
jgi:retron-type reverse transcriptase